MMLDVWRNMDVVGMGALKFVHVGVGHGITPPQGFALQNELIEVFEHAVIDKVDLLEHTQHVPRAKDDLAPSEPVVWLTVYTAKVWLSTVARSATRE